MGQVNEADYMRSEVALLQFSDADFKPPLSPTVINIYDHPSTSFAFESDPSSPSVQLPQQQNQHPKDEWLPITESRNGSARFASYHILNSNIGFQALMLPVAFATLGWYVS